MRKLIILTVFILIAFAHLSEKVYANDFIAQELRETYQEGEIQLDLSPSAGENNDVEENKSEETTTDELELKDNEEVDFELFKRLDEYKKPAKEDNLFGKILHSEITRTDIPTYLLEDELTFSFNKGLISKLHPWIGYRGNISSSWLGSNYSTKYNNTENQIGT